jgi:hypothetical protein
MTTNRQIQNIKNIAQRATVPRSDHLASGLLANIS